MKDLIYKITSNVGKKLKGFFLWFYIIECIAGFVAGIVGFVWCLSNEVVWYGLLFILGAILLPLILYPEFLLAYGYGIIVHKLEKGVVAGATNVEKAPVEETAKTVKGNNKKLVTFLVIIIAVATVTCMIADVKYEIPDNSASEILEEEGHEEETKKPKDTESEEIPSDPILLEAGMAFPSWFFSVASNHNIVEVNLYEYAREKGGFYLYVVDDLEMISSYGLKLEENSVILISPYDGRYTDDKLTLVEDLHDLSFNNYEDCFGADTMVVGSWDKKYFYDYYEFSEPYSYTKMYIDSYGLITNTESEEGL